MNIAKNNISRRGFMGGATALSTSAVLGGLFGSVGANAATPIGTVGKFAGSAPHGSYPFFAYHCSLVHKAMGDKLGRIVADPNVSSADTALALRSTFCPCCKTQISASYRVSPNLELKKV